MTIEYFDAYLQRFCDDVREARALADVLTYGTFPPEWRDRLVVLRAYITACIEHQGDESDLFTAKLDTYRKEWNQLLPLARTAAGASSTGLLPPVRIAVLEG